jgi:hypothetical protein
MVWRLTQVKAADQWADGELAALAVSLEEVGSALTANVDRDAASYEAVIAALRLPKTSEEEKAVRRHAIEAATRAATEVPLETARLCARVMEMCVPAAYRGYPGAVTDAGVGLLMGFAGLNGAFIVAIGSVMARGIEVDCGCFGLLADVLHLPDMADGKAIARNIVFIGMCLHIVRAHASCTLEGYLGRTCSREAV